METKKIYLNGEWIDKKFEKTIEVENPATKEIIGIIPACGEAEVDAAVENAIRAFPAWKETPASERVRVLAAANDALMAKSQKIADTIHSELGCPKKAAKDTHTDWYLEEVSEMLGLVKAYEFVEDYGKYEVWKEPVGVVACLTPWNYPLGQITQKIFPAMAMGNVVILKPSSQTPLVAYHIAEALDRAGIPKGVFQMLTGKGSEVGCWFAKHPGIDMVTFTGSTKAGIEVSEQAASDVKRVILELGGKSPALILEGADLDIAARRILRTVLGNVGQTCSAYTRVIAPRAMKEEVEEALLRRLKDHKVGDPADDDTTVGPLQSKRQFEKVTHYIQKGIDEGAVLLTGEVPKEEDAYYVQPVIFTEVKTDMEIAQDEIFGPVLSILYYDTEEEGIALANDTIYGLASAVFGPKERALKVARKLKAGNCNINEGPSAKNAPFGGFKHSGFGREGGVYGMEEFLELKTVFIG